MQGCAFWGARWWIITFRGLKSPKPPFWGPEKPFQAKYAKNSNSYIFRSVYRIDLKFDRQLRPATGTLWVVSYGGKTIPRWCTATILKIVTSPYLNEKLSDFDEICTHQQILNWMNVTWSKKRNEKVALDRLKQQHQRRCSFQKRKVLSYLKMLVEWRHAWCLLVEYSIYRRGAAELESSFINSKSST